MIRRINLKYLAGLALGVLLLGTSCGSPKRYAYMQDLEVAKLYSVEHKQRILIQPGDRLQFTVQSAFPELVAPFNGEGFQASVPGQNNASPRVHNPDQQSINSFGYTVNDNGEINLPVLGYTKVAGMTLNEASRYLEERIKGSKYVTDPRVELMISNFQIFLLGAVNRGASSEGSNNTLNNGILRPINGTQGSILTISDKSSLNILEALAYVGDLPLNANVEKVNVVRRVNGQFVTYRINLKSADLFNSPAFYLKQNDIVYVEYLYRRSENEGIERILQLTGYALSSISSIVAVVALLKR